MPNNRFFSSPYLKWSLISLLVLWVFAVAAVFYVTQKPVSPADLAALSAPASPPFRFSAAALGRTALDLAAALWLWALAFGLGHWALKGLFKQNPLPPADELLFAPGLGFGLLGLAVLALGLIGWLTRPILLGLTIGLSLPVLPQWLALAREWRHRPRVHATEKPAPVVALYILLTLGLGLTVALLPPTDWDGLFYHLTGPKLYLAAGKISPGVDIPHLSFPGLFEQLFTLALALQSDVTAKLLHFGFSLLLAGLVYRLAQRHLGLKNGCTAVLLLFSMPMVLTLAGWAYNDLALAFYLVASLYALLAWRAQTQSAWLVMAGLCSGLAMSLKYTSVTGVLTLGGLLLWWLWQKKSSPTLWRRQLAAFILPAIILALPWYLKNWAFTGNPVYPFLFGGQFWDTFRAAAYSGAGTGIGFNLPILLALPGYLTLGLYDANYIDGRSGPLFLAFLPILLAYGVFGYRKREAPPALNGLLVFALAQYAVWVAGVVWSAGLWQSRLLLPAFVALCPALAWLLVDLAHLDHPQFSLQRFLSLFIGVVLLLGLVDQLGSNQTGGQTGWLFYQPWRYLVGDESRADYLTRRLGAHYAAMEAVNQLPPEAVVVFLWEPRSYYCERDCRPDSILDRYNHLQYLYSPNAEAIAARWKQDGVTHVLVFKLGLDFMLAEEGAQAEIRPDPAVLNRLVADFMIPTADVSGAYQIYRLK